MAKASANSAEGNLKAGRTGSDSRRERRPALDGVRAVAILAVIAYHLGFGWAKGGFVGVDVFFVLSGYLITSLLLAEREKNGRIALAAFWLRRAKRLLPALFVMLVAVALWVGSNASPFELIARRDDLMSTLFYFANWHFIVSREGYFVQFMAASPVRHTWSLAIEEQFYLTWPIICAVALWVAGGRRKIIAAVCVVGILGSAIAMAALYSPGDVSRAYYGTDTRVHQLLIGALLAVLMRQLSSICLRRMASVIGPAAALVLLLSFMLLPDDASIYYRGLSVGLALVTASLVWAVELAPESLIGRCIGIGPMAWIGEISYGLYLWHWPIILAVDTPTSPFGLLPDPWGLSAERLLLTFGIATTSFYLLEQPIRRGTMPVMLRPARRFVEATLIAMVVVMGTVNWQTSGAVVADVWGRIPDCPQFSVCLRHQGPPGAPVVAVIGDSIPMSLDPAFVAISEEHGWTYVLEATGGCRAAHLMAVYPDNTALELHQHECYARIPTLERQLLDTWHPDVVIDIDFVDTLNALGPDGSTFQSGTPEMLALEQQALTDLAGTVTGTGARFSLMEIPPNLPIYCASPGKISTSACSVKVGETDRVYYSMYERLALTLPGVSTFSITDVLCPGGVCVPEVNGMIVRYDGSHFTPQAATWLAETIYDRIVSATGIP